ncbi:hypothetical protein K461DRAFT_317644 [Myriangium duriaei CBS 260.36]|uniref:Maintenance of telomere capping protein 6 n=1 Tax=Myriangium duriaei CBS 260.36 TaxID=1168546 RepID=A0A9P4JEV1_9PEZI|nr:hypothetical protein K461DRAFT_317644 [Myriangium duriaei CBS 260.36]
MSSNSPSGDYDPDTDAVPTGALATAILAARDVSISIPINFVTHPGVVLRAACFATNRYEDSATKKCLSNLLAAGFRRIIVDLYWDPFSSQWSLCPVALPSRGQDAQSSASIRASSTATVTSAALALTTPPGPATGTIHKRATSDSSAVSQSTSTGTPTSSAASSTTSSPSASPSEVAGSSGLFQLGPYQCTSSVDIDLIRDVFEDHFVSTGYDVDATLKYLIFNLHNSTILSDDTNPTQNSSPSPQPVSRILNATLAAYLYTPEMLSTQRANLNSSWFSMTVQPSNQPDHAYFQYSVDPPGKASTLDGWPSEGFAELMQTKRLLVGFGTSDLEGSQYNLSADGQVVFLPGELISPRAVHLGPNGTVTSGCILHTSPTSLAAANDSFAVSAEPLTDLDSLAIAEAASSLTMCGISPVLNTTLSNATADDSIAPYLSFVAASSWSWLPGQPVDQSSVPGANEHCAAMNLSASANGRWQVATCSTHLSGACRFPNAPLNWTVTMQRNSYGAVDNECPEGTSFGVPRTAAENVALRAAGLSAREADMDGQSQDQLIWLNLNDLDIAGCWVTGIDSRCPYAGNRTGASRAVIVPTVAAVIVFCLAALTVLVKCAASRRGQEKRRRRGRQKDGRGEYEGVPS